MQSVFANYLLFTLVIISTCFSQTITIHQNSYKLYPELLDSKPDIPSPFPLNDSTQLVIIENQDSKYGIIPITLGVDYCVLINSKDFPTLIARGLHSEPELLDRQSITNRSLAEITELGRPDGLSEDGFMAADEDIRSVLLGDNRLVSKMGLTHPDLARPLYHILKTMFKDLELERWNMAAHEWQHVKYFHYNGHAIQVSAHDTKGGQLSIFDDGMEGAFWLEIERDLTLTESEYLKRHYSQLSPVQYDTLKQLLTHILTGEMEPEYIMRYGFYEGHINWRTDPVTIAFMFGLKSLKELDTLFENDLYTILTTHFTRQNTWGKYE